MFAAEASGCAGYLVTHLFVTHMLVKVYRNLVSKYLSLRIWRIALCYLLASCIFDEKMNVRVILVSGRFLSILKFFQHDPGYGSFFFFFFFFYTNFCCVVCLFSLMTESFFSSWKV